MNEELEQARARLREIESNLALEIQRAVDGFNMQFGIPISDVSVSIIDVLSWARTTRAENITSARGFVVEVKCRAEI